MRRDDQVANILYKQMTLASETAPLYISNSTTLNTRVASEASKHASQRRRKSRSIHGNDTEVIEQCFANSIWLQIFSYFIALSLTVFNIFLLVQLALGNVTG